MKSSRIAGLAVFLLVGTLLSVSLVHAGGLGVRWGLLPPLTGPFATLGKQQMQGATLALEELKAKGGPFEDIRWFVEDTTLKAPVAVQKAEKLIEKRGVQFITGCISSSSALAVREVIDRHRVFFNPTVGTNMFNTADARCSRYGFRTELMTWQVVKALSHMVRGLVDSGKLGKRYWLVIPEYAYGISMRDSWRKLTRDFLEEVGYSGEKGFGLKDHSAIITEISAARDAGEVDFVASCLLGSPLVTFMQQAQAGGLIGKGDGRLPVVNPVLQFNIREIGDIALGHYSAYRYSLIHKSKTNRKFIKAYYERWGMYPDNFAHNAYVAVMMMAQGIKAAKSVEPGRVLAELEKGRKYTAPMGRSYFRASDHQIIRNIGAGQVVKVKDYPFPVMKLVGKMLNGKEAIAGIEQKCRFQ
ncbi:MAG: ABC transporter substrate-binding protein, partial [Deltaproteobacteria bacterium]|nr:ABC transporter substrate-binding protein [Deltaproteobacteria bacterium]